MKDIAFSDTVLIQVIGKTLTKITLFVCCAVVSGMTISTCQVDEQIIIQCEESCGASTGIKEVTGTKCECNSQASSPADVWVLPSN
jgi:hypothetical protein